MLQNRSWISLFAPIVLLVFACNDDPTPQADSGAAVDAATEVDEDVGSPDEGTSDVVDEETGPVPLQLDITTNDDGSFDLLDTHGRLFVRHGTAEVLVRTEVGELAVASDDGCAGEWVPLSEPVSSVDYFSEATGYGYECEVEGVALYWRVYLDRSRDVLLAAVTVENHTGAEITVLRFTPLMTEGPEGGLFVGDDPMRHRVLDNGSDVVNDIDVKLRFPDESRNPVMSALEVQSRGNLIANWNHAIADLDGGYSWVAGTLDVIQAIPTMGLVYNAGSAPSDDESGRQGFDAFYADMGLHFTGKPLADGASMSSETLYVDPMAPDPLTGLEEYADAIGQWLEIELWTTRDGGRPVPNGWNSWTGSGSTGGLGTNINETLMLEELEIMAREFAPFGIDYFQMDDGYQIVEGDWEPREDRFPSGIEAFSTAAEEAGLIPGIWTSAFLAGVDSTLATEHPDWLSDPADNVSMGLFSPDSDLRALDLSNDEVIEWLADTARRYSEDWRMGWLKLDFGYFAALFLPRANPSLTAMETYRRGIEAVGDALGDDVFYMAIGLMGVNYGVCDTMRLTLDNGPLWEEFDPFSYVGEGNNFKNGVRVASRRYFLNHRVWISHSDLLFFRTDRAHPDPPVTMEEATTLASFMGLSGGIVKFGEDLRTLTPEQINVWRRILPIYPVGARPMDLFTRHYPENYHLAVDGTSAGFDASWDVIGLLNWGRNYDFAATRGLIADEERTYTIDLAEWGLDGSADYLATEFWRESFEGIVSGELTYTVPAHGHAVIALRPVTGTPQLLGHNRHFTQGATDLVEERWDDTARTLTFSLDVDAGAEDAVPFEYRLRFYMPDDYQVGDFQPDTGTFAVDGSVLTYTFTPAQPGRVELAIPFVRDP